MFGCRDTDREREQRRVRNEESRELIREMSDVGRFEPGEVFDARHIQQSTHQNFTTVLPLMVDNSGFAIRFHELMRSVRESFNLPLGVLYSPPYSHFGDQNRLYLRRGTVEFSTADNNVPADVFVCIDPASFNTEDLVAEATVEQLEYSREPEVIEQRPKKPYAQWLAETTALLAESEEEKR